MLFILFPPRFVSSVRPCSARSRLSPSSKPSFLSCFSVACLFQAPDLLSNFSCCGISDSLRCFSSSPSCGLRSTLVLIFLPTSLGKYLSLHSYVFCLLSIAVLRLASSSPLRPVSARRSCCRHFCFTFSPACSFCPLVFVLAIADVSPLFS